jgi:hypothetical protein
MRRLLVAGALLALVGCGGHNGFYFNGNGTSNGPTVQGYVFSALRAGATRDATQQMLLSGAVVQAYALGNTTTVLATASADNTGHFIFSTVGGNPVPANVTLLLRATTAARVVSGLINTEASVNSKNLGEATHVAALAVDAKATSVSDAFINLNEIAARKVIDTNVAATPTLDYTLLDQQTAAQAAAVTVANLGAGGTVTASGPPTVTNPLSTPGQLASTGGNVLISATVADPQSLPLTTKALIFAPDGSGPQIVSLTGAGGQVSGSAALPANTTTAAQVYVVAIAADNGVNPYIPQAVLTVTVLPSGQLTLSIIAETLYNEPVGRNAANLNTVLAKFVPTVVRGSSPTRQVTANQTIIGVSVNVDSVPGTSGTTDQNGSLVLNVPMSALADGVLELSGSYTGLLNYHQFLALPAGLSLQAGDTVDVNLVMASQGDWTTLSRSLGLGSPNYSDAPLVGFFGVLNSVSLGGVSPAAVYFRPTASALRSDFGNFFAGTLAPGTVNAAGVFADPNSATGTFPFGPIPLNLPAGDIDNLAALLPPGA